jgi:hypothetical protein
VLVLVLVLVLDQVAVESNRSVTYAGKRFPADSMV